MSEGASRGGKFLLADDVSDSDEQDMDMDSTSEAAKEPESRDVGNDDILDLTAEGGNVEDGEDEPPRKRTLIESDLDSNQARTEVPKWSNPDPYADLFLPEESHRKRKDVVKLIRKARIATSQPGSVGAAVAANDDFISLNFDEDDGVLENSIQEYESGEEEEENEAARAASNAPSPHSKPFSHRAHFHNGDSWRPPGSDRPALVAGALGPPPQSGKRRPAFHELLDVSLDIVEDSAFGSRKRTRDDSIKRVRPPPEKFESALLNANDVLRSWAVKDGSTPIPWGGVDHSRTVNMGFW
jgi:non-canonical poly(A) RNA polymerase PAPD5/7